MVTQPEPPIDRAPARQAYARPVRAVVMVFSVAIAIVAASCADDGPDGRGGHSIAPTSTRSSDQVLLDAAVAVRVTACRPLVERGTGLLVEPGRVLTSAHVVAGATSIRVFDARGDESMAEVIAFDPVDDLAVLAIDDRVGTPIPLAAVAPSGTFDGQLVVFRQDLPMIESVEVLRRVRINTDDIYRAEPVTRAGYELRADVRAGDSGGVVVSQGEAVAVVWSRSRVTGGRAWAIDPIRGGATVRRQLADGVIDDTIDLDRCA